VIGGVDLIAVGGDVADVVARSRRRGALVAARVVNVSCVTCQGALVPHRECLGALVRDLTPDVARADGETIGPADLVVLIGERRGRRL
jgi:hypothetical protein